MRTPVLKICSVALAAVFSSIAAAGNAYLGVRLGDAMQDRFDGILAPAPGVPGDIDRPFGLHGGWNFNENWALEAAYVELGHAHLGNAVPVTIVVGAGVDLDGRLLTLGGRYALPIGAGFDLQLGAGFFDLREDGIVSTFATTRTIKNNDNGYYAELGARYRFTGPLALRAAWQWFDFHQGQDALPWVGVEFNF